ncbi:peptidoglycan DD-metalloendopeptidase family protein [Deefgea sp. CFH1-16]|uniref:peptidoglycan DD-metalloendopeptidase family protein n=1 Tax=Deefgea sp. CFH1-16 TaxID=2675457 RepID=UPI0015F63B7A|nr:peptidoglycan DD-metalloendopeptidase family protein [Deefgea sp. CFH1-16]MBM5575641.1 peptidoglycan DD-metalloendopeptidase family protein [Deefgea sp. CFH1-16]
MSAIRYSAICSTLVLCACSSTPNTPAPIVDRSNAPVAAAVPAAPTSQPATNTYTVKAGDGLYRIALENGVAYKDLVAWNQIEDVNGLRIGQVLRLGPANSTIATSGVEIRPLVSDEAVSAPPSKPASTQQYPRAIKEPYSNQTASSIALRAEGQAVVAKQQNISSPSKATISKPASAPASATKTANVEKSGATVDLNSADSNTTATIWTPPTAGKVSSTFSAESKGIDIKGQMGQSIVASGSGKVVYAGSGLKGYGKMLIIQHSDGFLSAYAHNSKLLVKENDLVKKGEKIAEMGNSDSDQVKLHFELRKFGKPVDPSNYIKLN